MYDVCISRRIERSSLLTEKYQRCGSHVIFVSFVSTLKTLMTPT